MPMIASMTNLLFASEPREVTDSNRGKKIELKERIERFVPNDDGCEDRVKCMKISDDAPSGIRIYYHCTWVSREKCSVCKETGFAQLSGYSFNGNMKNRRDMYKDSLTMAVLVCPICYTVLETYPVISVEKANQYKTALSRMLP